MIGRILIAMCVALLIAGEAVAHGGGGGGGGRGGGKGGGYYGAVFVAAPAPQVPAAAIGDYQNIHTVAVLSAIGGTMQVIRLGMFTGGSKAQDISAWNVDDLVQTTLKKYLGARFTFKDVSFDHAALEAIPNGSLTNSEAVLETYLAGVPDTGIDAFIVVRPDLEAGAMGAQGISFITGNGAGDLWLNYEIDIVDAKTHKQIAKSSARLQLRQGPVASVPGLLVVGDFEPDASFALAPSQMLVLRNHVNRDLQITLLETIRALSLGVDLPWPGARKLIGIPPAIQPMPAVKTVAIVSAIGDQIEFDHVGSMFGAGRSTDHLNVPADWNIDAKVEALVAAAVAKRFTVKDSGKAREKLYGVSPVDDSGQLRKAYGELLPRSDIDAYIVVLKYKRSVDNLTINGIGLANRGTLGGDFSFLFVNYVIAIVDAHSLTTLSARASTASPRYTAEWPMLVESNSLWPTTPPNADANQLLQIHNDADAMLDDSVHETLLHMGVTGEMISTDFPTTAEAR